MLQHITIAPHLTFDALVAGEGDAPLVLLLHGFAESMHCWRAQLEALADAGYRAVAPSQRGYSPGARPDPRDTTNYDIERLMDDAMAIAAACGHSERRFHLVGHDWGGSIAWALADRYPERLASLTILSRPHPNAFNRSLQMPDGEQAHRSRHHTAFLEPDAADVLLADMPNGCASVWPPPAFPEAQSRSILPCSATAMRWKQRSPGIARAARSARPLARSACRRSISGAMPMRRSGGWRPKARRILSPHPIASRRSPASATLPANRCPNASTRCCCRTLPRFRCKAKRSAGNEQAKTWMAGTSSAKTRFALLARP